MIRVWIIFNRPFGLIAVSPSSVGKSMACVMLTHMQPLLKDYAMVLFILSLVVIDVFILGAYTVIEGVRGNLGVILKPNREMHQEIIGVIGVMVNTYHHI